jgi:predicted nucleic acid-binding protein
MRLPRISGVVHQHVEAAKGIEREVDRMLRGNLIQIGHIDLLSTLANKTVLPSSGRAELLNAPPANVRTWATNSPGWVEIHAAKQVVWSADSSDTDPDAITFARELNASFLLMDYQ